MQSDRSPFNPPEAELYDNREMLPCRACGTPTHISAAACAKCGASQRTRKYRNKNIAAVLAFFLGGLGVHRFYLGQWWGIFYLLLCLTGIPGLIAFFEFIYFLARDQFKWDLKYNEGRPAGPGEGGGGALVVVVVIIGLFMSIAVIGILAAIALPAYHDYSVRARVNESTVLLNPIKTEYREFYTSHNMLPDSNIMIGLEEPHYLQSGDEVLVINGGIAIRFKDSNQALVDGKTLIYALQENGGVYDWDCTGGNLDSRFRPVECR